uniref:TIGR01212 family radical SAM protein n=1 Tax=Alistipes sp. TaxID=1872444 RepID=UPI004056B0BA
MERPYRSYAEWFRRQFGGRVQKLSIDAGFSCPNRDGTYSTEGCTFCLNEAFTPSYCHRDKPIRQQIEEGISFHKWRYRKAARYVAYFQAYSNTYAPVELLRERYAEALAHPEVVGLIVGTRPDTVDEQRLDLLAELARERFVAVEYGVESTSDQTLREINRGHDFAQARWAIEATARRGLHVGAHFILGLPGESDAFLIDQTEVINSLPLTTVKFHQLQLFRGTKMAELYDQSPDRFRFWSLEEYLDLMVEIFSRLRPDLIVERFASEAPPRYHHGPNWGLVRNEQLWQLLEKRFYEKKSFQGEKYLSLSANKRL